MQLAEEKVQEIDALKVTWDKMKWKDMEEITELKKVQYPLIVEQAQMCARCGKVEQAFSEACRHIFENMAELTLVEKAKWLGQTIVQIQDTNLMLNALVQPMMLPKHVVEWKASIEEIKTQFESMEQEAKTIMEVTTYFWQSVVQDG